MLRFLKLENLGIDALQLGTYSGFNCSKYSQTQAGSLDYEDVPVTDLEFLLEVRELLWPPRERAKPYSLTC